MLAYESVVPSGTPQPERVTGRAARSTGPNGPVAGSAVRNRTPQPERVTGRDGQSYRAVGEKLGINASTVKRGVDGSGVADATPQPERTTGRDGKSYRTIGEKLGIGEETARRDAKGSVPPGGGTAEGGQRTKGRDGKRLAPALYLPEVGFDQVQEAAVDAAVFPPALGLEPVQDFPGYPQAQVHFPGPEAALGGLFLGGHARILPVPGSGGKR